MIKYFPLLIVALFIDGLQGGTTMAFWGAMGVTAASVGWIPFIGQAASVAIGASGTVLSMVITTCLSMVFGAATIMFLILNRIFYPVLLFIGGVEMIPMLNNLPGWSALVAASIYMKYKKDKAAAQNNTTEGGGEENMQEMEEAYQETPQFGAPEERVSRNPQRAGSGRAPFVDGINATRAANANGDLQKHAA